MHTIYGGQTRYTQDQTMCVISGHSNLVLMVSQQTFLTTEPALQTTASTFQTAISLLCVMRVCVPHACLVPAEVRREHGIP